MTALRCWRAAAPRLTLAPRTHDTAPWPLLEAGYGAVTIRCTVRG